MSGRSTTVITYEPPMEELAASPAAESEELAKLQEKVRALEMQNAALRQGSPETGAAGGRGERGGTQPVSQEGMMEISLIDMEGLSGTEGDWLCGEPGLVGPGDEMSWLRRDIDETHAHSIRKKSLVNRLEDLARRSPSAYSRFGPATSSPLHSYMSPTPSSRYSSTPSRGPHDSRTFTRGSTGPRAPAYSLAPEDATPLRKTSYHRLAFGARNSPRQEEEEEIGLDQLEISDIGGELKVVNTTFDKVKPSESKNLTFNNCDDESNVLNGTFDKVSTPVNSTFNRGSALNSTFSKPGLNTTFEKLPLPGEQRKMSEDRLSSSSSTSNRLSRESSQDLLVEDLDRLSTTSAMSESSASHRLNDVQDVQDLARLQEENLKHSTGPKHQRSETISPLSEGSLCSPVEDHGGYQSEESCGSENGIIGSRPRRGEVQYQGYQQYSSQDSLPDSPYSSQSLDSHGGAATDTRRSMPNLNKVRGGKGGPGHQQTNPQYGLSQARYTSSDSRLLPNPSRIQAPGQPAGRGMGLRPPQTTSGLVRPSYSSGLRPPAPGGPRKVSGIARPGGPGGPGGIPRPGQSRLQAPGSYQR